jgi:uncharacterized protein (TIGR03118 family)
MFRPNITRKHSRNFVLLSLAVVAACFLLMGWPSAARLTKQEQARISPDGVVAPENNGGLNIYRQLNLVSDVPNLAQMLDPNLVNPWGLTQSATSPFWVANNVTSTATLYGGDTGSTPAFKNTLTVTIPGDSPTGTVFNGSSDFVITAGGGTGPARFIFASTTGNITAWRAGTAAIIKATQAGHVYTGLAIGNNGVSNFLYAGDVR